MSRVRGDGGGKRQRSDGRDDLGEQFADGVQQRNGPEGLRDVIARLVRLRDDHAGQSRPHG